MDAFDDQHLIVGQTELIATIFASFGREVVGRQVNRFAMDQFKQVAVEEGQVDGLQMFEVELAIFVHGVVFRPDKVVVGRDGQRA